VASDLWAANRWTLDEIWALPTWATNASSGSRHGVTTITTIRDGAAVWFWIEVDAPLYTWKPSWSEVEIEEPQTSGTPGIVFDLMNAFELADGNSPAIPGALTVSTEQHLRQLIASLQDEDRFSAIYVTIPPQTESMESWTQQLDTYTKGSTGMAITVVVEPSLQNVVLNATGFKHSIPPGGLRTFLPGVKFNDESDSYRHKLLSPSRISLTRGDKLGRLLRRGQVQRLSQLRLPRELLEVDSEILRKSRFTALGSGSALMDQARKAEKVALPVELENVITQALSERSEFEALANEYANENETLRREVNDAKEYAEIASLLDAELSAAQVKAATLDAKFRKLQAQLSAKGFGEEAYGEIALDLQDKFPDYFEELIDRINEFEHLVYVGNPDDPIKLDEHPGIQSGLNKAWETLRTLDSYAKLKSEGKFTQGLQEYVRNSSHGGYVRIPEVKASESSSVMTNPRLSKMREIPVPVEVADSGFAHTKAHVALQNGMSNYPRMYFYDATGKNGSVYIGYIGEHLENTRTN
jgi:hypothetical protein